MRNSNATGYPRVASTTSTGLYGPRSTRHCGGPTCPATPVLLAKAPKLHTDEVEPYDVPETRDFSKLPPGGGTVPGGRWR